MFIKSVPCTFGGDDYDSGSFCRSQRIKPIVVDPALYLARRTQLFTATEKRPTPDAFKVFTGKTFSS